MSLLLSGKKANTNPSSMCISIQGGTPYKFAIYALTAFILLPAVLAVQVRLAVLERNQVTLLTFSHVS